MANLLSALVSSAGVLGAYDQVLQVTQNNVANASTPGYAKQSLELIAQPFDTTVGDEGGVRAGKIVSTRDEYSEQNVRTQTTLEGQRNKTSAA